MPSQLHERIRFARKRLGLSQKQLSERLPVSQAALSTWEHEDPARRNMPGLLEMKAYCDAVGVDLVQWMLNDDVTLGDDEPIPSPLPMMGIEATAAALRALADSPVAVREAVMRACADGEPREAARRGAELLLAIEQVRLRAEAGAKHGAANSEAPSATVARL